MAFTSDDEGQSITTLKILIIGESGVGKSRYSCAHLKRSTPAYEWIWLWFRLPSFFYHNHKFFQFDATICRRHVWSRTSSHDRFVLVYCSISFDGRWKFSVSGAVATVHWLIILLSRCRFPRDVDERGWESCEAGHMGYGRTGTLPHPHPLVLPGRARSHLWYSMSSLISLSLSLSLWSHWADHRSLSHMMMLMSWRLHSVRWAD